MKYKSLAGGICGIVAGGLMAIGVLVCLIVYAPTFKFLTTAPSMFVRIIFGILGYAIAFIFGIIGGTFGIAGISVKGGAFNIVAACGGLISSVCLIAPLAFIGMTISIVAAVFCFVLKKPVTPGAVYAQQPPLYGQNPYMQNTYGQNPYAQQPPQYGQNPYGQQPPLYGQNPYMQNPYGQNPYAQQPPQYGQNPYGQPPQYGQNPYAQQNAPGMNGQSKNNGDKTDGSAD